MEKQTVRRLGKQKRNVRTWRQQLCRNFWFGPRRERRTDRSAHLGQFEEFDRLFKQALVLGLQSHFTDDGSGVPGELIYDSRLQGGGEKNRVRLGVLRFC